MLPEAVILKHHDASFVGLPDCSVHWRGLSFWFEFKLWIPTKEWSRAFSLNGLETPMPYREIAEESPVQFELMKRMAISASDAWYIFWINKTKYILLWHPITNTKIPVSSRAELLQQVVTMITGQGPVTR